MKMKNQIEPQITQHAEESSLIQTLLARVNKLENRGEPPIAQLEPFQIGDIVCGVRDMEGSYRGTVVGYRRGQFRDNQTRKVLVTFEEGIQSELPVQSVVLASSRTDKHGLAPQGMDPVSAKYWADRKAAALPKPEPEPIPKQPRFMRIPD
jgi:hypothetical protein